MTQAGTRCAALGLIASAAVLVWQELTIRYHYGGNQTALFFTGSKHRIPPQLQDGTYVFQNSYGYDGQFYRYAAHDPFLKKGLAGFVDDARLRYGRILVPLMAWGAAGGQERLIDKTYQLTVTAFCGLGVYWTCAYLTLAGCAPWWGLLFILLPATLASLDRMLVDGALCALFAGYLYYLRLGRFRAVYIITLLAPLVRETGFLLLAGVLLAALAERQWRRMLVFSTAAAPALLWSWYVTAHTTPTQIFRLIGRPVFGLFVRLFTFRAEPASGWVRPVILTVDFLAMAGFILSLALAAKWIWSRKEERLAASSIAVGCFVLLGLLLGSPDQLLDAYGYARPVSPVLLWVALQSVVRKRWLGLAPPLAVSIGVGMYCVFPALSILRGVFGGG
jgi:hypothetical protein